MAELDDYAADEAKQWGTWVAKTDIGFGNTLAYRAGDPVPVVNVEAYGYEKQGLVEKTTPDSKSAEKKV